MLRDIADYQEDIFQKWFSLPDLKTGMSVYLGSLFEDSDKCSEYNTYRFDFMDKVVHIGFDINWSHNFDETLVVDEFNIWKAVQTDEDGTETSLTIEQINELENHIKKY